MFWMLLLLMPFNVLASEVDTLHYHSDFQYTQADIDSLLASAPKLLLHKERIKSQMSTFWEKFNLQFNYDPFEEFSIKRTLRLGVQFSVGADNRKQLHKIESRTMFIDLKIQARNLMKQREGLIADLHLADQQLNIAMIQVEKERVAFSVKESSSDNVAIALLHIIELNTKIYKIKLDIKYIEDQLKALVGRL